MPSYRQLGPRESQYLAAAARGDVKTMTTLSFQIVWQTMDLDAERMNTIGRLLLDTGELDQAQEWFARAAETGHVVATHNMGFVLSRVGRFAEGADYYRRAAEAGSALSMIELGKLFRSADPAQAEDWFLRAIEAGPQRPRDADTSMHGSAHWSAERKRQHARETTFTGAMLELGILKDQLGNPTEAKRWWRRAAEAGDIRGARNLGLLYLEAGDVTEAEIWSTQAAELGDADAMNDLGRLWEHRNHRLADHWYRRAFEAGNAHGHTNLLRMYGLGREHGHGFGSSDYGNGHYGWT